MTEDSIELEHTHIQIIVCLFPIATIYRFVLTSSTRYFSRYTIGADNWMKKVSVTL